VPATKNKINNMEIVSFTFGVLSVIAVVFAAVIILSIVKVLKQQNQIKDLQEEVNRIYQFVNSGDGDLYRRIENDLTNVHRQIDETRSYIDSRIDKLTASKQVIKG
jgi:peptidoglycan hydrolase CwlO-like protein